MHAELTTDGGWTAGVPGLAKPMVLNETELSAGENDSFARLVAAARAERSIATESTKIPDGQNHQIVIVDGDARTVLSAADPSPPPKFCALMHFIREHGHR